MSVELNLGEVGTFLVPEEVRVEIEHLVSEVVRLRALIRDKQWADNSGRGESYPDRCPWCRESCEAVTPTDARGFRNGEPHHDHKCSPHAPDCPAFTPSGEVK